MEEKYARESFDLLRHRTVAMILVIKSIFVLQGCHVVLITRVGVIVLMLVLLMLLLITLHLPFFLVLVVGNVGEHSGKPGT